MSRRYIAAIVLFEGVNEPDLTRPRAVFAAAAQLGAPLDIVTLGWPTTASVPCSNGRHLNADYTVAHAPRADMVLIPGGPGIWALAQKPEFLSALRPYIADARMQLSVGAGSALLGRLGFLEQRRATTSHDAYDFFRENAPAALLVKNVRYVHDDNIVTAANAAAAVDMAHWLVGHLFGGDVAQATQRQMHYTAGPANGTASA